jgi:hypothetical protein
MRTAPLGAVAVDENVAGYAFLRRAIPIRPNKPEPKSHTAAGTGTGETAAAENIKLPVPVMPESGSAKNTTEPPPS